MAFRVYPNHILDGSFIMQLFIYVCLQSLTSNYHSQIICAHRWKQFNSHINVCSISIVLHSNKIIINYLCNNCEHHNCPPPLTPADAGVGGGGGGGGG